MCKVWSLACFRALYNISSKAILIPGRPGCFHRINTDLGQTKTAVTQKSPNYGIPTAAIHLQYWELLAEPTHGLRNSLKWHTRSIAFSLNFCSSLHLSPNASAVLKTQCDEHLIYIKNEHLIITGIKTPRCKWPVNICIVGLWNLGENKQFLSI